MTYPEHVEELSDGGIACKHCGGMVEEDGFAIRGLAEAEEHEPIENNETDQHAAQTRMHEDGFANALRRRGMK